MFGETLYRYPKIAILLSTIKDLFIPYILQVIIIARWNHLLFGHASLLLILALPCLTAFFTVNKIAVYRQMYDIACRDIKVQQVLLNRPDIDREDYLLWATMEAFVLYQEEHYEELQAVKQKYITAACASVFLQALLEPLF